MCKEREDAANREYSITENFTELANGDYEYKYTLHNY